MKGKVLVYMAAMLLLGINVVAQVRGNISGLVADSKGNGIASVTVSLLLAKDSSLAKADVSNANGKFEIPVNKSGNYLLNYSAVGFQNKFSTIYTIKESENIVAATVQLVAADVKLQGVTVTTKKPLIEVKAGKTVFNVEASINATGSNAMELLQKSPGVQVDNNDNITMKGKTGVRIYVDGKMMQLDAKDLAAYLRSINSNDMEAIEMISNPSAKYDASGNAGIINIRLKKNKKFGTNGSINLGMVQGYTPKGNGSLNLNYRDKKINIFGNIGGVIGIEENRINFYRIQKDSLYNQHTVIDDNNKSYNLKAGIDFFINSKSTFGILATTNYRHSDFSSTGNTVISYNPTGAFVKTLIAYNTVPLRRTNSNFNINYRYADTSGTEINFDADRGLFRGAGHSYQPNYFYDLNRNLIDSISNRNYTPTDIDIYTAKLDVESKLGKGRIGYGAKTSFVTTENTFDFYNVLNGQDVKQLSLSNNFKYTENVNAVYVNYQQQVNDKWSIQAGLRAEQTNSNGILRREDGIQQPDDSVKKSYQDFFPSGALSWNVNKKHTLSLTYSRRIDRPSYQDLNPFENKLDQLTYEKGNAFLRPQYTNIVELTHTFLGLINTTIGYSHVKDYATATTDTINNATYIQMKNFALQQIYSFSIGSPLPINKWWSGYANIWYNYQTFNGTIGANVLNTAFPSYGAFLQQSFILGKDYTAEITGEYNGPGVWGGTWRSRPSGGVDVGMQKLLFKKKATIKISATDVFFTQPWNATSNFGGLYIHGSGSWESQTYRVSFSWRFGSNQIKKSRERQTGLESESKRIKK